MMYRLYVCPYADNAYFFNPVEDVENEVFLDTVESGSGFRYEPRELVTPEARMYYIFGDHK